MTPQLWLPRHHCIAGVFLFQLDPLIPLTGWYLHGLGLLLQFVILRGRSFGCHRCFFEAVFPLLLASQGSMLRLRQLRSLMVWPLNWFEFYLLWMCLYTTLWRILALDMWF